MNFMRFNHIIELRKKFSLNSKLCQCPPAATLNKYNKLEPRKLEVLFRGQIEFLHANSEIRNPRKFDLKFKILISGGLLYIVYFNGFVGLSFCIC